MRILVLWHGSCFHALQRTPENQSAKDGQICRLKHVCDFQRKRQNPLLSAAGVLGAQGSYNKRAFFDKTIPVIMAQMVADRAKIEAKIRAGLLKSDGEYPLHLALSDLEKYYQAGTITSAIASLGQTVGETAKQAEVELTRIRDQQFVAKSTQERIDALLGKIDKLPDTTAIDLEKNPPVSDPDVSRTIALRDPGNKRFTDGKVARQLLKMRAVLSGRSEKELLAWEAAVKSVQ